MNERMTCNDTVALWNIKYMKERCHKSCLLDLSTKPTHFTELQWDTSADQIWQVTVLMATWSPVVPCTPTHWFNHICLYNHPYIHLCNTQIIWRIHTHAAICDKCLVCPSGCLVWRRARVVDRSQVPMVGSLGPREFGEWHLSMRFSCFFRHASGPAKVSLMGRDRHLRAPCPTGPLMSDSLILPKSLTWHTSDSTVTYTWIQINMHLDTQTEVLMDGWCLKTPFLPKLNSYL